MATIMPSTHQTVIPPTDSMSSGILSDGTLFFSWRFVPAMFFMGVRAVSSQIITIMTSLYVLMGYNLNS